MIEPTREEWRAARDRVWIARGDGLTGQEILRLTEVALGCPCPPEPPPRPLRKDCFMLVETNKGVIRARELALTPGEARAMADALLEHADYACEQGYDSWRSDEEAAALIDAIKEPATPEPICGRLRVGYDDLTKPLCVLPRGHEGACKAVGA